MKRHLFFLLLIMQGFRALPQSILTGVVIDEEDHKPVEYVSIGITRTPNGTVSNSAGVFSITFDDKIDNKDTLKFSSVGYQSNFFGWRIKGKIKVRVANYFLNKKSN